MSKTKTLNVVSLHVSVDKKPILRGVSLTIEAGKIYAVMGPNGSGKSTLAYALMGHPSYSVTLNDQIRPISPIRPTNEEKNGKNNGMGIWLGNKNLIALPTEERAKMGLFLALQSPIAIPGVSVVNLLRTAYQDIHGVSSNGGRERVQNPILARRWRAADLSLLEFTNQLNEYARLLHVDESFLSRGIHDGFSGGEKKKIEMLQALVLRPRFAIFDEVDTGLDIDAIKAVAGGIDILRKRGTGIVLITHYQRILRYVQPDYVHVLVGGRIVESGTARLATKIEERGYKEYIH